MRSLPETSTRLPADANVEMPRLRRAADASTAMPRAPDCAKSPNRPCGGRVGARDALSRTAGSLLISPKEFGPTTRIPDPARAPQQLGLEARSVASLLGEAGGHDEQRLDPGLGALVDDLEDGVRRNRDDGEVDRAPGRR